MRLIRQYWNISTSRKLLSLMMVIFFYSDLSAEIKKLYLQRHYPVVTAANQVWIGTPNGLYQYTPNDDSFKRFSLPTNNQNNEVKQLYYYEEWLWCVLDSGLAALHVRLNEWLFFNEKNGLPSPVVTGLDFQGDYVWIATDNGAARYDLLIEEWEIYDKRRGVPGRYISDLVVTGDQVWFATKGKFSEYNPDFEKWRHYRTEQDTAAILKRVFLLGDELWLVSDHGLIRFNSQLQTQQYFYHPYLKSGNLLEIILEDDNIWTFTRLGLYYYEQKTGVWREFEGNSYLKPLRLKNGYITPQQIWLLTNENVLVWDRSQKRWEILDYASGLSASVFEAVYSQGNLALLLSSTNIDYRRTEQEPWRKYPLVSGRGISGQLGKNIFKSLFDNETGGHIPLGKYKWSWEGSRIILLHDYQQQYDRNGIPGDPIIKSGERLDIKSQLKLGKSQNITGFYNNIDYSEIMYGLRYKSREKGIVRELNWGDFRREPGKIPFGETANVFGSNIWLQTGKKTPRFKRSRFTAKAQTGEQRSQKTYQYFQGTTTQFKLTIPDTSYLENQFFSVPGMDTLRLPDQMWIYVDDLNPATNTRNTLVHENIAGIAGDFDLWKQTEDYYFYDKAHVIRFLKYVNPNWTIVIRFVCGETIFEEILQHGSLLRMAMKNFYYLNAQKIIPYSFRLKITDYSGVSVPLNYFNMDEDLDGRIDARWIDYDRGILFFPQSEPFPAAVYDPEQRQSSYRIEAEFQTEFSLIQLEHNNLVRGSETLRLDGLVAMGGNDYVVDYTNGTLIFVREGVVNVDTRIEIEYEYYLTAESKQIHSVLLNWSPSDNFYLQGDWLQQNENSDRDVSQNSTDIFTVHGEVRQRVGQYDVRLIPGLAYQPEENQLTGINFEGLVSSSKVRFQTVYQNYSRQYTNIYRPRSILGDVKSNLQFFATADVRHDLRLSGEWKVVRGFSNGQHSSPSDQSGNFNLLFHRKNLPSWQFSYQKFQVSSADHVSDKSFFQNRWEYQLPRFLLKGLPLQALKIEAYLRSGQQTGFLSAGSNKQQFRQGYLRLNAVISNRFQSSLFYRRNDLSDISSGSNKNPMLRSERLLVDLTHEEWRLIRMNLRIENNMIQHFHRHSIAKNVSLKQFSQINFRLSPGRIWWLLAPFYFEVNINQSLNGWGAVDGKVGSWVWEIFRKNTDRFRDALLSRNYFVRNEFRPGLQWFIYSLLEWNYQETIMGASRLDRRYRRWSEKLDWKLGFKTRINLQYRQFYQHTGYEREIQYYEPSAWLEYRLTPDFQNILYVLFRRRQTAEGRIENETDNVEVRYDLILRKYHFLGCRRMELRQSFSGTHRRSSGDNVAQTYQLGATSSMDLYPLRSMIVRLRFDFNQYLDSFYPEYAYYNFMFNLKISLRF